jgi:hypothetical protein
MPRHPERQSGQAAFEGPRYNVWVLGQEPHADRGATATF